MADRRDEVTEKLFPPPGSNTDIRLPPPTIREEFLAHRLHIDQQLESWGKRLDETLGQLEAAVSPSPSSVAKKAGGAVLKATRYGGVALLLGEAAAQAAHLSSNPQLQQLEGPIRVILQLFGVQ